MGGICRLPAMIVLQIDCLRGSVVPPEGDSPICIHTHRVPPRGEPLERVKPEPGHIEIPDVLCAVQDRQNASHSLLNVRVHASWIVFFPESAQGLAAESADHCCVTYQVTLDEVKPIPIAGDPDAFQSSEARCPQ